MLASWNNRAEKNNPDDLSLAGDVFDTDKSKAAVDSVPECRNKTVGPSYAVELGRLDGKISTRASVRHHLPHPDFKLNKLNAMFDSHGLTLTDLVCSMMQGQEILLTYVHPTMLHLKRLL
ncbi:Peroxidase 45 [Hibiscus syriacus]|uniref:peroxidase n=1 Tax=Hibiscus syriacus TaxID=106335 RepID=A0A6A2X8C7_HIBSY|nr:Peroxidase 45 [Hibiscus syriacus]